MSSIRGEQLLSKFLGPDAARNGPFGMLGIDPSAATPSGVEAALERQLDRIAQHPDTDSPAADAVRLALDNAAAELLDPIMRAKWIAEYRRAEAAAFDLTEPGSAAIPLEPEPEPAPPPIAAPASSSRSATRTTEPDAGFASTRRNPPTSGDPLVKRMLLIGAVGLGVMLLGLVLGVWLLSPSGPTPPTAVSSPAPAGTPKPPAPAAASTQRTSPPEPIPEPLAPLRQRGRTEFVDGPTAVRDLRTAATEFKTDPDRALARFDRAYAAIADWWCRYDPTETRAAADAVVECIYQIATRPDHLDKLLAIIVDPALSLESANRPIGADEVWPAAWSAGVLARANRERDLPPQTSARLWRALTDAFGSMRPTGELSFESGIAAAVRALPASILAGKPPSTDLRDDAVKRSLAAMQRWVEGVTLTTAADPDRRERQLVDALGYALTQAPESDADPRVFDAISLLASEIKWRTGGPARPRVMDWFRDSRVSNQDIRTLTSAIATRSSAEGVDQSMVLSMSASGDDRVQLRVRYANAWGIAEASGRAETARDWLVRAKAAAEFLPRDDELDQLAAAAELAELNREAVKLWRGESAGAASPSPAAPAASHAILPSTANSGVRIGSITGQAADGAWAERFLAAERNIPVRLERLTEIEQGGPPLGFIDAGVLAENACFGSPVQVRTAAQRIVAKYADEPAMVNAMLDVLPIAPRIRSVSDTFARVGLATLPRPTNADWELLARRALVERLLAMLADEGVHGQVEQLASRIASAYLDAAGEVLTGGSTDASAAGSRRGAEMLADQARREADGLPITRATRLNIDQIERRRQQRRSQAIGPVQAFSAEQTGLAEVTGYLVASERPERETAVIAALDEMAAQRRAAQHVFAQLWAAERAIVRLWMLRLSEEGAT